MKDRYGKRHCTQAVRKAKDTGSGDSMSVSVAACGNVSERKKADTGCRQHLTHFPYLHVNKAKIVKYSFTKTRILHIYVSKI